MLLRFIEVQNVSCVLFSDVGKESRLSADREAEILYALGGNGVIQIRLLSALPVGQQPYAARLGLARLPLVRAAASYKIIAYLTAPCTGRKEGRKERVYIRSSQTWDAWMTSYVRMSIGIWLLLAASFN